MIAHIVFFEPKDGTTTEQRQEFLSAILDVTNGIGTIRRARIGKTIDVGLMPELIGASTYNYAAVFEFADRDGLEQYLKHPVHDRLRKVFWERCKATMISDVELLDVKSVDVGYLA